MKFIHSSDWQLGMTRHFLPPEAQSRFTQERIDAITALGELAREHGAAFIVVSGDVFESNQVSRQTVTRAVDALNGLPVPVFLLPGNHDPLDAASVFDSAAFAASAEDVIVLRTTEPLRVPGQPSVEVVGAPWTSKRPVTDLCSEMLGALAPAAGTLRIGVAHGQLDSLSPDAGRPETILRERVEDAIREARVHYLALGDRHSVTSIGSTGALWYSGAPVATDFDEVEPNHALLVDIEPGQMPDVQRLPVGRWTFLAEQHMVDDMDDVARVRGWLSALPSKERTIIKIAFMGTVNLTTAGALDGVMAEFVESFASLRRHERIDELVIAPDHLDEDSITLTGYAKAAWDELVASAGGGVEPGAAPGDDDPDERYGEAAEPVVSESSVTGARDALSLFYRLARSAGATGRGD